MLGWSRQLETISIGWKCMSAWGMGLLAQQFYTHTHSRLFHLILMWGIENDEKSEWNWEKKERLLLQSIVHWDMKNWNDYN
jgi:hypothetical protein